MLRCMNTTVNANLAFLPIRMNTTCLTLVFLVLCQIQFSGSCAIFKLKSTVGKRVFRGTWVVGIWHQRPLWATERDSFSRKHRDDTRSFKTSRVFISRGRRFPHTTTDCTVTQISFLPSSPHEPCHLSCCPHRFIDLISLNS